MQLPATKFNRKAKYGNYYMYFKLIIQIVKYKKTVGLFVSGLYKLYMFLSF